MCTQEDTNDKEGETEHRNKEKHLGSETKSRSFPALVAVLILALLAVGTWATAGAAGDGTTAPHIPGTGQTGGKNPTSDNGNIPAARPHPRGLPRGRARLRGRHQENRDPGSLVTETVSLISVIGAGLRRLVHPRSRNTAVEDPAGSERARGPGQDTGAMQRYPLEAGITRGFTLPLGGGSRGRRR
jgi:hypothetical protein